MYYEDEQDTDIIGCLCTLLTPYKGHTEVVEYRDEVLIYD